MKITFDKEKEIRLLAAYVSQLIREGVTFEIKEIGGPWIEVILTGGF